MVNELIDFLYMIRYYRKELVAPQFNFGQIERSYLSISSLIMADNLFAPLEELEKELDDMLTEVATKVTESKDTKIPIPNPSYLMKESKLAGTAGTQPMVKHGKEFEEFCKWSALPKELRKPKTAQEWERKNKIARGYTHYFKTREDFRTKTLTYFWDWMMDMYPDVVYAVYQRATNKKGSDKAAGIFIDLLSKKMNLDKPRVQVQPMVLMGVEQSAIDKLFTPKDYTNAKIIPEK